MGLLRLNLGGCETVSFTVRKNKLLRGIFRCNTGSDEGLQITM
jgi:hypothetical protein